MKRDARLHGLTLDHNHGLMFCSELTRQLAAGSFDVAAFGQVFDDELEPHFRQEEELLLPGLREAGEVAVVQRTETEHARLRSLVQLGRAGDLGAVETFARELRAHVHFEEHELFACAERSLTDEALAEVARLAPKKPREV